MDFGKEVKGFNFKPATFIAMCAVCVLAIVYAIVTGTTTGISHARNWFWALAGVLCLGEGIVLYVHSLVASQSKLLRFLSVAMVTLGTFWLFMDIVFNGGISGTTRFGGWWLGLIIGAVVGAACLFIPMFAKKKD
ncbi:MAG: hypothetical protein IJR61_02505 [Clostridia bacterium]|nr:hypothetical protein [Clostridia bacterium]